MTWLSDAFDDEDLQEWCALDASSLACEEMECIRKGKCYNTVNVMNGLDLKTRKCYTLCYECSIDL